MLKISLQSVAFVLFVVTLSGFSGGCASVSTVQRDAQGGTLALQGRDRKAMAKARDEMAAHCAGRYEIVEERRMKAGEQTDVDADGGYDEDEDRNRAEHDTQHGSRETEHTHREGEHEEHQTTTTSDVYEKWLTYRCT